MNAIISGQSGCALVGESARWSLVLADEESIIVWDRRDLREVFHEADDLEFVRVASLDEARAKLDAACDREEALLLALNLLDLELSDETRAAVADDLEKLMARESVREYLAAVLFARPLGAAHDLVGAMRAARGTRVRGFCADLARSQSVIEEVWFGWEAVPDGMFQDSDRAAFRATLVRGGWFARLVRARVEGKGPDAVVARMLVEPALTRMRNFRQVAMQWVKPLRVARKTPAPEPIVDVEDDDSPEGAPNVDRVRSFERVERQKAAIVQMMDRRDEARVSTYVDQLIEMQVRGPDGAKYAAKSLCDLAQKAAARGLARLQLRLTTRAVEVCPDDGWSWQQHSVALRRNGQLDGAADAARRARMFQPGAASWGAEAEVLRSSGRLSDALAAYDEIARLHPDDVVARNGRAEVLKALGRLPDALAAYDEIARLHPDDVVARTGRAEVLKALGRLPDALAAYDEIARLHPDDVVARNGRAEVLKALGRLSDALAAYDETARLHPDNVVARTGRAEVLKALGRLPDALAAYDETARLHPDNVVARTGRAEVLKALGRLPDALAAYDETARLHPDDVVARTGRAEVLKALGRLPDALAAYDETARLHPDDVVARNGRAEVLKALGRLSDALAAYDETARLHPDNVVARTGRAEVFKALGRLPDALAAYDETARLHPDNVVARNGRAEVLKALGRLPDALAAYDETARLHPDDVVARTGRAEVLKALGRLPDALAAYDETARLHPDNVVARTGRAEVLKALGRLPDALAAYDETARLHPDDVVARTGRAEVLKALGRLPDALAAYDEIARLHPDDVVARNGRAEVLKALGRLPDALAAYEESARAHPEDAATRNGMAHVLVLLREWDRALALLPQEGSSRQDWIGLHIRGMLYLRRGQVDEARAIFERGVRDCLFADSRDFFRTALVMTRLRQNRHQEAAEELKSIATPTLATPAKVLQLHAYGAMGDVRRAKRADEAIPKQVTGVVLDLRLELERRYIQKKPKQHDDAWVFENELNMLAEYAQAA